MKKFWYKLKYQIEQKPIFKRLKNKAGFSFIETILYLAIVTILLTAVVDFHLTMSGTSNKVAANIEVSQNRRATLNIIDYLARNADGLLRDVDGNCFTTTTLALYFNDDTYLPGTCVQNGGGVQINTNSNRVKMTCYPNIINNGE